ncbi:MAG: A/G-specific adenine glycosylase [Chitinophagales bacterium]|nr:A/G-specific adenine glycosylase [Chitinophagales bacterium]
MSALYSNKEFAKLLLEWNQTANQRSMPWKGETNPYLIWLSEIILQQTRVEQGLPYYQNFVKKFPKVKDLASAPETEIMKLWQGLGYYSRARNLHFTAKYIYKELKGVFPNNYKDLLKLKGVGSYTAAAIASFAFNEPVAVVDGNVIRVFSRVLGIHTPFDSTKGKKQFFELAQNHICRKHPAKYNQAIMDFGATVCTPKNPACQSCVFAEHCYAFNKGKVNVLPVKAKPLVKKKRTFVFVILTNGKEIFLEQRTEKDIWKHLFQPPIIEVFDEGNFSVEEVIAAHFGIKKVVLENKPETHKQTLTHQQLNMHFVQIKWSKEAAAIFKKQFQAVSVAQLNQFALPKAVALHFHKISLL